MENNTIGQKLDTILSVKMQVQNALSNAGYEGGFTTFGNSVCSLTSTAKEDITAISSDVTDISSNVETVSSDFKFTYNNGIIAKSIVDQDDYVEHRDVNGSGQVGDITTFNYSASMNIASWVVKCQPSTKYVFFLTQKMKAPLETGSGKLSIAMIRCLTNIPSESADGKFKVTYKLASPFSSSSANLSLEITTPPESRYFFITFNDSCSVQRKVEDFKNIFGINLASEGIIKRSIQSIARNQLFDPPNRFVRKQIMWFGTSIPAASLSGMTYPAYACNMLGCKCQNNALGSSTVRRADRNGQYAGLTPTMFINSLAATKEEKQYIIDNWDTINPTLDNEHASSTYPTSSDLTSNSAILRSSFEDIILPYLSTDVDLIVFDHGHNDQRTDISGFVLPDGTADITLEPTVENIQSGLLAEDTYMVSNDCYNLKRFVGDLGGIPSYQKAQFIASLNRNCYIGAMNFLMTVILRSNPRMKFAFVDNIDAWSKPKLLDAQDYLSKSWCFPILHIAEKCGFSSHIIPGTKDIWDTTATNDLTMKKIYMKDGTHPNTDTTGESIRNIGTLVAMQLYCNSIVG